MRKKLKIILVAVFTAMTVSQLAIAQSRGPMSLFMTGEDLTRHCRGFLSLIREGKTSSPQVAIDSGQCMGFVIGVTDAIQVSGFGDDFPTYCPPRGVNSNALVEIVARYVDENPAERTSVGYVLVREALSKSLPCN